MQAFGGADVFSVFCPLFMVVFAFFQLCGVYNRILVATGMTSLGFDPGVTVNDEAHQQIERGKVVLRKKREAIAVDLKPLHMAALDVAKDFPEARAGFAKLYFL